MTCAGCGSANRADARFCDACGAPLAARRPPDAVARKVVTIVFADLIGSTSLHERLDAESVRRVMDRYYRALRAAVEAHGGTVVQLLGDGVMAPSACRASAEDDAIRAVRAAVGMQRAFRELAASERAVVGDDRSARRRQHRRGRRQRRPHRRRRRSASTSRRACSRRRTTATC